MHWADEIWIGRNLPLYKNSFADVNYLIAHNSLEIFMVNCTCRFPKGAELVVLSSGMACIINTLLERLLGSKPENIFIVANNIESRNGKDINLNGGWQVPFTMTGGKPSYGQSVGLSLKT
jgi:hypothetical protein